MQSDATYIIFQNKINVQKLTLIIILNFGKLPMCVALKYCRKHYTITLANNHYVSVHTCVHTYEVRA